MNRFPFFLLLLSGLAACTGTDFIDDPIVPERLRIAAIADSLAVGQNLQLTATYTDQFGQPKTIETVWHNGQPNLATVSENGLVTGLAAGMVTIMAQAGAVTDTYFLRITDGSNGGGGNMGGPATERMGKFEGVTNHYQAKGTARLLAQTDGSLVLRFDGDFATSPGPNLYVLLANHTNGAYTVINGGQAISAVSLQVTPNKLADFSGSRDYALPSGTAIDDYDYAVLYCTLGPVFGFAKFN